MEVTEFDSYIRGYHAYLRIHLKTLMKQLLWHPLSLGTQDSCSVSDYVNGDSELPVCTDLDNDHWEDNFMDSLTQENTMTPTEEDSDLESDVDLDPPVPVIKDFKEAIQTLEHVQHYLESHNCLEMATKMSALLTEVAAHQVSAMHQTTLTQFFSRAEDTDENVI